MSQAGRRARLHQSIKIAPETSHTHLVAMGLQNDPDPSDLHLLWDMHLQALALARRKSEHLSHFVVINLEGREKKKEQDFGCKKIDLRPCNQTSQATGINHPHDKHGQVVTRGPPASPANQKRSPRNSQTQLTPVPPHLRRGT